MAPVGRCFRLLPSSSRVVSPNGDTDADNGEYRDGNDRQQSHVSRYYTAWHTISQINRCKQTITIGNSRSALGPGRPSAARRGPDRRRPRLVDRADRLRTRTAAAPVSSIRSTARLVLREQVAFLHQRRQLRSAPAPGSAPSTDIAPPETAADRSSADRRRCLRERNRRSHQRHQLRRARRSTGS